MLKSLKVEGYRGFERYEMRDLARVNLLVGQNNCGKTSLLEAVRILAAGGDLDLLGRIASDRGEMVFSMDWGDTLPREPCPIITHFFNGYQFVCGSELTISADSADGRIRPVRIRITRPEEDPAPRLGVFREYPDEDLPVFGVVVDDGLSAPVEASHYVSVSDQGAISRQRRDPHFGSSPRAPSESQLNAAFVSSDSLQPRSMAGMWNRMLAEGRESDVTEAMRGFEPRLEGVFFLSGENPVRFGERGGVLVGLEGIKRRLPLGTMGDGMRRLLALSLALAESSGGVLLIDEIDTGLHYSVMGDMWRMVVATAERLNVQVFATTHSFDCIRGLAWLCNNYPDLGEHVSLQKIEPELDQSVALGAAEIVMAVEQGMEVR